MKKEGDIKELFEDKLLIEKIRKKLPKLFKIAEIESSRAGKIGMEVGSLREKIISALLIYKFGEKNVNTEIPITETETDVILFNKKISIKTVTGNGGVKAVWTVDAESAKKFMNTYEPKCDLILVQVWWGMEKDSFFYIPCEVQKEILKKIGKEKYLNLPKAGTNARGAEFSKEAISGMIAHPKTTKIKIFWENEDIKYNVYQRWVDYWSN